MSDSEGDFNFNFNFTNQESNNSTNSTAKEVKSIRFGVLELGIFFGLWVLIIVGYKSYVAYKKKSNKSAGWFGPHEERLAYQAHLAKNPDDEDTLRRLLVRRAMTDVRRLRKLQDDRDTVMNLGKVGAISEDMLNDFKAAEKDMEFEFFELQAEAETFKKGWSQQIIKEAAQLVAIEERSQMEKKQKDTVHEPTSTPEQLAREKAKSERTLAAEEEEKRKILEELLKLDANKSTTVKKRK